MGNTQLSQPDGVHIVRLLLAGSGRSTADVRDHLPEVALRHPCDLERHVRWLQRGIYATTTLLRKRQNGTTFDPISVGSVDVVQWIKIMWIIINRPQITQRDAEELTKCQYPSWTSFGYAPMTQEILGTIGTSSPEQLERLRNDFSEQLASEKGNYSPAYVHEKISSLFSDARQGAG